MNDLGGLLIALVDRVRVAHDLLFLFNVGIGFLVKRLLGETLLNGSLLHAKSWACAYGKANINDERNTAHRPLKKKERIYIIKPY